MYFSTSFTNYRFPESLIADFKTSGSSDLPSTHVEFSGIGNDRHQTLLKQPVCDRCSVAAEIKIYLKVGKGNFEWPPVGICERIN